MQRDKNVVIDGIQCIVCGCARRKETFNNSILARSCSSLLPKRFVMLMSSSNIMLISNCHRPIPRLHQRREVLSILLNVNCSVVYAAYTSCHTVRRKLSWNNTINSVNKSEKKQHSIIIVLVTHEINIQTYVCNEIYFYRIIVI
jgi:hypothetical protein